MTAATAHRVRARLVALMCAVSAHAATANGGTAEPPLSPDEIARIVSHGPWPTPTTRDPSNRVSGKSAAIELGRRLFFDPRMSNAGYIACVTCHQPDRAWTDGKARAHGMADVDRNTMTLQNLRTARWFGWGGSADNLWAQSIRPILDPREVDSSPALVKRLFQRDPELACLYRRTFGVAPTGHAEAVLVNVGKALAAFQETLVTGRTPFDELRDALATGDAETQRAATAAYPPAALRGLRFFVGTGRCAMCHAGPNFTNGEFHDIGIPFFVAPGKVDPGRHEGIRQVQGSRFNLLGRFSDDARRKSAIATQHIALEHRNWGEFRVPSLRNVAVTAPYMHNGSLPTLRHVLGHYSEFNEDRVHLDGERILRPLRMSDAEIDDAIAFLDTLTDAHGARRVLPPQAAIDCRE
jgi:cytochrome c peroxidase